MAIHRLCGWHDGDGDLRGWSRGSHGSPDISCSACRADGSYSPEEVEKYEKEEAEEIERRARITTASNGAQIRITCHSDPFTSGGKDYKVVLLSGVWPSKDELVFLCENYAPFGAVVKIDGDKAEVYVHGTD